MKKLIIFIILILIPNISIGFEKTTNFDLKKLLKIQKSGKTIVVNSWNEYCSTCAAQDKVFKEAIVINSWNKYCGTCKTQSKIFTEAINDFKNVEFLFYEQTKHKDIAKELKIDYWTTIVVFKGKYEITREIGLTKKEDIYNAIKKGI